MKTYERGMCIRFNSASGKVTVIFRGERYDLPQTFDDDFSARHTAEEYCRSLGWSDPGAPRASRSPDRSRRAPASGIV
jgi:hypothetical protein